MFGNSVSEDHRRKRVRKGTKSCWECKRRKVKCIPSPELSICTSCLERNVSCISQEYVDEDPSRHEDDSAMARRMARVESLLETLMERIPGRETDSLASSFIPGTANEPLSFPSSLPHASRTRIQGGSPTEKLEILRQRLARMLPLQDDVDILLSASHGWWLIQQHMMTQLPSSSESDSRGVFVVSAVTNGHPIKIARLLLCIAICIQQLPPDMDMQRIQTKVPLRQMMSSTIEFLAQNVTSDDEIIGSIEGVECLALQGIYEVNAGNLRRSWLSYRKAITIAHLLGLHRVTVRTSQAGGELMRARRHHLWYQVSRGERYLSTLLGVPSATGSAALPFDDNAAWLSPEDVYHKHLYHIAGLILARNQEASTHSFSTTQRISEQLESLAGQMPSSWWEIPRNIPRNRTRGASTQFERVMCQIWHFELETLLHLPFMLRTATDRRYEYSHVSCLNASRSLIKRWISIRESDSTFYFSNLLEFEAFTAATTLLLGLLGPQRTKNHDALQERRDDSQLVETVIQNFERLQQHGSGIPIVDQSISVIRTLQSFIEDHNPLGNLYLEIPFFGTIKIARSGAVQPLEGERIMGANGTQNNSFPRPVPLTTSSPVTGTNEIPTSVSCPGRQALQETVINPASYAGNAVRENDTVLEFSGGHFQLSEMSAIEGDLDVIGWPYEESDILFFDSLVNTDLVGNWTH